MVIFSSFMWCCQATSSKILPNHISTHTNKNSSSHLLRSLHTTYHSSTTQRCICHFRWPWSSSPSFSPRVAFLPHSLGKHHPSPPGWGSHCPGPTNSWPQRCNKIPMDEDKLLKWYIVLYTPPQKKIRILSKWPELKGYKGSSLSPLYQCILFRIYISMNHRDFLHRKTGRLLHGIVRQDRCQHDGAAGVRETTLLGVREGAMARHPKCLAPVDGQKVDGLF